MRTFIFTTLAVMALAVAVVAQASLSSWPYYVEVVPESSTTGMYDFLVPLAVFDKSGPELGDLRLFDASNREIPYAIRIRKEIDDVRESGGTLFNRAQAGSASEVSVDLGDRPEAHNQVEIKTGGSNFRRLVTIEGSDSRADWRLLTDSGVLFRFTTENSSVDSDLVSYPTSRYRYLRIRVQRDALTDNAPPQITGVRAMMNVREQRQLASWSVPVPPFQLLRHQGAPASAWIIDLGGQAPVDQLKLEIADDSFHRPFQVEAFDDPQDVRLIALGTLTRHSGDADKPLLITFEREQVARKLRLQITDHSNPTLSILSIEAAAPARQLVYELKQPPVQPLRLYFGNTKVSAPHYDFEQELESKLSTPLSDSTLGAVTANPEYRPEPRPLTERVPWLIYLVLAASSIALAFILLSLARAAMKGPQNGTNGAKVDQSA